MEKMEKVVSRKQIKLTLFWAAVLIGVVCGYLAYREEMGRAAQYLREMNWVVLLLIIPTIILMYYAAGWIWYPYLKRDGLSAGRLAKIQYELNFVNTVVPFLSIPGLLYATERLKKLGISGPRASGMYMFRYVISIFTKWIEIALAMVALTLLGKTGEMPKWTVWLVCLLTIGILAGCVLALIAFPRRIGVPKALRESPKWSKQANAVQEKLEELFDTLELAFRDKAALAQAFVWGMLYSLLEVLPFYIVALAMGQTGLLLQIIVASGVAITLGVVIPTPMGIGGLDGAMIIFMGCTATNAVLASIIVLVARMLVLAGTTATGIPFWMQGMRQIGKD